MTFAQFPKWRINYSAFYSLFISATLEMELVLFFRRKTQSAYSIESIFEPFAHRIVGAKCVYVPFQANSFIHIVRNIYYARTKQGSINHITGDIHYAILGLGHKKAKILTIHDCGILFDSSKPKWELILLKYLWFKWPVRIADIVTTVSEKSKSEIIKSTNCPSSKIIVIPNYVNPGFILQQKEFNSITPRILHIGSTKNKNLAITIRALKGIQCELRIIGMISEKETELLRANSISYTQLFSVSFERLRQEYCDTDIVLFVSTYEGFGLPILEAQVTGRVLITSDISPCREVAGKGALCINPNNILEIREAIENVIRSEKLRSDIIEAGLQNVKMYSMDVILCQYKQVYSRFSTMPQ